MLNIQIKMSRTIQLFLLLTLYAHLAYTQSPDDPIEILLLGTFHFEPSTTDTYKNKELDINGEKKQEEIKRVVEYLTDFHGDQICIEAYTKSQQYYDSLLQAYLNNTYALTKNEIDQLGLRLAKETDLSSLTCVNYQGSFDPSTSMAFAQENGQEEIIQEMSQLGESFIGEINRKLESMTIRDFLIYMNSDEILNKNASYYTKYFAKIGKDDAYPGTDLVSKWYTTNLHIYTNILRNIKPGSKKVIVLFGQGHIPILRHLFETNPDFKVIAVKDVLGK